ncbi:cellulose synthase subunit BcsC [Pectobacterium atrosepticum ICMP 1526]|uniref:cellulose synthase complex outer membrane protein BcsC n=1 Tax=Pectobacterium atrosepticum TaxID=29471 RepID=UPI00065D67BC|nr:cellulose synthase subunit BcsC [Pectobacterium atrosepticum ICMP 1526]
MHNNTLNWLRLLPLLLIAAPQAYSAETVSPEQFLMEQVRLGEASNKDDIVRQSLYRLELIAPNNPEVIAAKIRLAMRYGDQTQARQLLEKLKTLAPDSTAYRHASMILALTQEESRQQLQKARSLSTAGRYAEAKAQYDALFHGDPPTLDLAVEYWRLVSHLPNQELVAIKQLVALDQVYPDNVPLHLALSYLLFRQDSNEQTYPLLKQLANAPVGRSQAASLWLAIIRRMPITPQSVAELNRFLTLFNEGKRAETARNELNRQQKMLSDPTYQAHLRSLVQVENGGSHSTTLNELNKALAATPNAPELIGAIGLVYLREGDRKKALEQFQKALQVDMSRLHSGKWEGLIQNTQDWTTIAKGDNALKANNLALNWLRLLPLLLVTAPQAYSAETASPEQFLMEQVRLGEANNKDDIVRQSLHRLELINPDNPEVVAARFRLVLRQGDQAQARQQLEKLKAAAPDSAIYRQSAITLALTQEEPRKQLQQARLLSTAGRYAEAKAQYDALFQGDPPTLDLAVEYWRLVSRLPDQQPLAIKQLETLDQAYPNNVPLRMALARLLFSQNRSEQAYPLLKQLSNDPVGRGQAASLWLEIISRMLVTPQSVAELNRFLTVFDEGEQAETARKELSRQQGILADPVYQGRLRALAQIEDGGGNSATLGELNKSLAATPNDPELIGAIGLVYLRAGDRVKALAQFQKALQADVNRLNSGKWEGLIQSTQYWTTITEGDNALKANNLPLARQKYQQARQMDNTNAYALIGLGDVAVASKNDAAAQPLYQQALQLEPGNDNALRGLVGIYQRQSPEKALAYLNSLPRSQQNTMRETLALLQLDILKQQADQLLEQQQWALAEEKYRQVNQQDPNDIWFAYRYAQVLRQLGKPQLADSVVQRASAVPPASAEKNYVYSLYLSSTNRDEQALAHLNTLPAAQWNDDMRDLSKRLTSQTTLAKAEAMRDAGDETAAMAFLRQQPADTRIDLLLADWALARGEYTTALAEYQRIRTREPQNPDAQLGEIDAFIAQGQQDEARQRLNQLPVQAVDTLNGQRRVANAWQAVGNPQKSTALFRQLKIDAQKEPISQGKALVYRDAARVEQQQSQPEQAQQDYKQAMVASGIAPALPQSDDDYTRLTRNKSSDDWLQRSIRADAADLYRKQDIIVTLDHDYGSSSGTGGISDLSAHNTMLQVDMPLYDGRAFFRTDTVQMNAGSFSTDSNGAYRETFGTCATRDCFDGKSQKATGTSVAAGWKNDRWSADIGTTPLGFDVVDVVGGASYRGDWRQIGWTATASRRPISSSLLAFGGTKDPGTGITWGGVRATGVSLGLSYDRGEAHGVWSDFSVHQITGKNVADNDRARAMAGYYYKLINEDNQRVTVGLNSMWWRHQKDLSGYSLGQGGYYSPQQYFSLGVPVNYRQRTENWSWELGGSVSWSRSSTKNQRRYPLVGLLGNAALTDRDDIEQGSSSSGFGYTARAIVERRLSSHWTLGVGIDIQQAKDYTPSHGLLYLRYSVSGWQGDLDSPPQPLTPYADFK